MSHFLVNSILFIVLGFFGSKVKGSENKYGAAVVEYHYIWNFNDTRPIDIINRNVDAQVSLIQNLNKSIDIVVFPEADIIQMNYNPYTDSGIFPIIPNISSKVIPCSTKDVFPSYFMKISCAARNSSKYVIINISEKEPCDPNSKCASYGYNLYNTDVAFDRNGTIIARYRKFNLFGEFMKNVTKTPEHVTFTTDFGVTFGMFTCFDILFEEPSLELVRKGIKHFVFPTFWFSEIPFLTALQAQQMWAEENNVTLLAANENNYLSASSGSGIFEGEKGPIVMGLTPNTISSTYFSFLPSSGIDHLSENTDITDRQAKEMDKSKMLVDNLTDYKSHLLNLTKEKNNYTICDGVGATQLCCKFEIEINVNRSLLNQKRFQYVYHLVAFSGVRSFSGVYHGGIETCAVVGCLDYDLKSCGYRFKNYSEVIWPITFKFIKVQANYTNIHYKQQYPNSLLSSLRPLHPMSTIWEKNYFKNNTIIQRTHELTKPQNRLLTFGIYGRDFSRDKRQNNKTLNMVFDISSNPQGNNGKNRACFLHMSIFLLILSIALETRL